MRIAIIAPGSRGDVEPYLALGKGLKQAGHVVRLVTHQNFEGFVNSHGVEFWPVEGNVQDIAQGKDMRALLERGNFLTHASLPQFSLSQAPTVVRRRTESLVLSTCSADDVARVSVSRQTGATRRAWFAGCPVLGAVSHRLPSAHSHSLWLQSIRDSQAIGLG